jgi:hypothetical protein
MGVVETREQRLCGQGSDDYENRMREPNLHGGVEV